MRRVALLGGSFDPIHLGHLAIAEEARVALQLERVLFVPAAQQPLKSGHHYASPEHRLEMVRLAIADNPAFQLCDVEMQRAGPSYTVETLELLRRSYGPQVEFFFILGADALQWFSRWREPGRLLELAQLVVVERPGFSIDLEQLGRNLPLLHQRLIRLEGPHLAISATELRARVAAGRPVRYLVPDAVATYITQHRLYVEEKE